MKKKVVNKGMLTEKQFLSTLIFIPKREYIIWFGEKVRAGGIDVYSSYLEGAGSWTDWIETEKRGFGTDEELNTKLHNKLVEEAKQEGIEHMINVFKKSTDEKERRDKD